MLNTLDKSTALHPQKVDVRWEGNSDSWGARSQMKRVLMQNNNMTQSMHAPYIKASL